LRRTLLVGLAALLLASCVGAWGYRRWAQTHSIRIARQWLDANRLDRASPAVEDALATEPGLPASWRLASELAWRKGNWAASVGYARKAAVVGGYQADDVLAWAEASLLSDDADQAREAETHLDAKTARESPRALRLAGEIDRRGRRFAGARDRFEAALQADARAGARELAVDEVPLAIVSLQTGEAADRTRGQALLARWAADPVWGAEALRALIGDAEGHGDREAAARWAESLRAHPRCTLGDIPVCLRAIADFDPARYNSLLAPLEEKGRSSPTEAAQVLGWLAQIGQGAEAVRWGESLDPAAAHRPPVAPGIAEALRATHRWADLQAWVDQGDWGPDLAFLQWAYGMVAARHLGEGPKADSLWRSLDANGRSSPAHALFAGDSLYAWGYPKEAAELLWEAAERQDLAFQALGSLARLYQVQRDAAGQYRAFEQLNAMRPGDRDIANNYAYFAALTDEGSQTRIERIAEEIFTREPSNVNYRSTLAFVLVWSGQAPRALALMEPVSRDWRQSPAIAFAYGAALAGVGRKAEAKEVFDSLNPRDLGPQEADWIRAALR
jgi:predicted Zn-dependent protease